MQDKQKKVILIIDDEQGIRDLLMDFFESNNFKAVTAPDGVRALDAFKENHPDIVLTDLLMPGEHGITVIKAIKEKYGTPVIIMTSVYKEKELKDLIADYFVEAFFDKPLDLNALLEKVTDILDAKPDAKQV